MPEIFELKAQANKLRKTSRFAEALPIYKALWEETRDAFDGSGYLSCLRKLRKFDLALPLATELLKEHSDFEWARKEAIWTLIQGKLLLLRKDVSLVEVINTAKSVMETTPDFIAKKLTVFTVLKHAKKHNDWNCIAEWIDLLDPLNLSDTPLKKNSIEGWSDREIWYNYKINSCLKNNNAEVALELCNSIKGKYPKHSKFFTRLGALSLKALGRTEESIAVYKELCYGDKVDWWLLYEYGSVLSETGGLEKTILLLCKAAIACPKSALAVRLYQKIGDVLFALQDKENAFIHYALAKAIRTENNWPIPSELQSAIVSLESEVRPQEGHRATVGLMKLCRETWKKFLPDSGPRSDRRQPRIGLKGRINIVPGRRVCFINCKDGLSAICMEVEIPPGIKDGEVVRFDAVPSFDKKKSRESWRAKNVQRNADAGTLGDVGAQGT
ncbi:MAG: hypothetical protein A2Z08_03175 [Deltaproteobacteria bacterium RBG_16_54_11]|nr:MAG: hypothetical protein A2Z08_03175 [Deltaproteobacteria bacterium RBG_16_54_11]